MEEKMMEIQSDINGLKQLLAATNYKSSETRRWRHIRCGI